MSRSINKKFRQNIVIISIIITVIFLIINISLYIINNNYLVNKVEEENRAFLDITTHILNENEISVALEYVEHYTHIHEVDIEILNENDEMLFSSNVSHRYTTTYIIETAKGTFTVLMDNTESITVNRIELNTLYVNVSLLVIYGIAVATLFKINQQNARQINSDINNILDLMITENATDKDFNHIEFEEIFNSVSMYLENIDILNEQKEMNMKGLAHDIKTPLTLVYSYFERVQKSEELNKQDRQKAFEAARRVNELLNDLIENKESTNNTNINLSQMIQNKLIEYKPIFENKGIRVKLELEKEVFVEWNNKDLTRVIDNLISNVYYYSEENSTFRVILKQEEKVFLDFISKPMNIDEFNPNMIFRKGYRGKSSKSINSYGKGYGLYLCKILLGTVSGTIRSKIIGENVKFTIIM